MTRIFSSTLALSLIAAGVFVSGCKKDDNNSSGLPTYTIPASYNFPDADSLSAKTTLSMLAEMEVAINAGNVAGTSVDASKLKSMYGNQGSPFSDTAFGGVTLSLNNSGMQLKMQTRPDAQDLMESILDSIGVASATGQTASNGVAGVSDRKTLLSANGRYWRQFFTKSMMGVLLEHQIIDGYLGDSLNNASTQAARIHAWDQAFYLWCVPGNFPDNRVGVKYWGSYTSQIDSGIVKPVAALTGINANTTLLNAFLKGRAALSNNDNATALEQAAIIVPFFETMEAAAAVHETNEARGNLANGAAAVCGNLSESIGFWTALKYNGHRKISDADIQAVLDLYADNFYNITPNGITAIQDKISSIYGWDAIKTNL